MSFHHTRKQAKANRRKVFPTAVSWGIVLGYVTAAPVSPGPPRTAFWFVRFWFVRKVLI